MALQLCAVSRSLEMCIEIRLRLECRPTYRLRSISTVVRKATVNFDVIQMICRWANPESLKIYALHGTSLHINWVDQAEKASSTPFVPPPCPRYGATAKATSHCCTTSAATSPHALGTYSTTPTATLATPRLYRQRLLTPSRSRPATPSEAAYACPQHAGHLTLAQSTGDKAGPCTSSRCTAPTPPPCASPKPLTTAASRSATSSST